MEDERSKKNFLLTREFIEDLAREENLILLGAVDLNLDPFYYKKYLAWIKKGNQAGMSYMENYQQMWLT